MRLKIILYSVLLLLPASLMAGNKGLLSAGPVFSKVHNGQWENGIGLTYTHQKLWSQKIGINLAWTSNEFGTGISSENVFTKHTFLFITRLNFRPAKTIDPYLGVGVGYAKTFFDDTDPVEKLFNEKYAQSPLVYGVNLGIRWNLHKIYGGPVTGIKYDLKAPAGLSYPLTTTLSWSFPLFPRKL